MIDLFECCFVIFSLMPLNPVKVESVDVVAQGILDMWQLGQHFAVVA